MATFYPLVLESGSITAAKVGYVMNYMKFPISQSVSSAFSTTLPDPYYFQTQSANLTSALSTTSQSLMVFNVPTTTETQYYATNAILGVSTAATTTGVRIGLQPANLADRAIIAKVASTLTAFTIVNQGTKDAFAFVLPASMAAINTIYPATVQGILTNSSTTGSFDNKLLLQSEIDASTVTCVTASLFYNQFIGYTTSSASPVTSSAKSLYISGSGVTTRMGAIGIGDTITGSVLPPTASLWLSQSLATAVTTTSNVAWSDIFSLTGLTSAKTYLVNFYLIARSAATTTGVQIRFLSGSVACRGTIYNPASATAYTTQNSADGVSIINSNTAWPVANTNALIWGEFTFVKTSVAAAPALQVQSEILGSSVTVETGSVVFYRAIE